MCQIRLISAVAGAIKAKKEREQKFEQKPLSCRINKMDAEITCECPQPSNKQTNSNNEVLFADAELKTRVFLQEKKTIQRTHQEELNMVLRIAKTKE